MSSRKSVRRGAHSSSRVVIDTNVVLSALVFAKGPTARLRTAWRQGLCTPLVSRVTTQELVRVLSYPKFRLGADAQHELLADYLPYAEVVLVQDPPPSVPACRDVFDLAFLHLALAGRAQTLVTGDADLLVLAGQVRHAIVTPEMFARQLLPLTDE